MPIDFSLSPELEEIRATTRDFIENVVKPIEARTDTGSTRTATGDLPL